MRAVLMLEDGTVWTGQAIGASGEAYGEVVFTTGMTGYQETLTDASYCGEIVTMTYPLIGNCGINREDFERNHPYARGYVVGELAGHHSNWRATGTLDDFLAEYGVIGIAGIDTRALTRVLRERGTMRGAIVTGEYDENDLLLRIHAAPDLSEQNLVQEVTCKEPYVYNAGSGLHIVLVDFGAKASILSSLARRDCRVTVVPAYSSAESILALHPDAVVFSNGPGDPKMAAPAIATARKLIGQVPIFGICLGHQLISLALGADTYKLKYGHRGANHPVQDLLTGKVYITSQNHGFAVAEDTLPHDCMVSHRNLNDGTVEGIRHKYLMVSSVQYHPEASPGPQENHYLFDRFLSEVGSHRLCTSQFAG